MSSFHSLPGVNPLSELEKAELEEVSKRVCRKATIVGVFLGGVSVGIIVTCFIAKHDEDQLRSRLKIAGCSFKGQSENTKSRTYECPDGLLYIVDGNIRNAKGE